MRSLEPIQQLFSAQHKLLGVLTLLTIIRSRKHHQSYIREVAVAYSRESTARHVATGKAFTHFSDSHCTRVQLGLGVACISARAASEVLSNNVKKNLIDSYRTLL